jgi:hypothetical protein
MHFQVEPIYEPSHYTLTVSTPRLLFFGFCSVTYISFCRYLQREYVQGRIQIADDPAFMAMRFDMDGLNACFWMDTGQDLK